MNKWTLFIILLLSSSTLFGGKKLIKSSKSKGTNELYKKILGEKGARIYMKVCGISLIAFGILCGISAIAILLIPGEYF